MKFLLFMIISVFIFSCGEEVKNITCKDNPCKNILNSHCLDKGETFKCVCNDNFKLDGESCVESCNFNKIKSDIVLESDSCGELTVCDSSNDCKENERCENLPITGENFKKGCCVVGLRGCKPAGEVCTDEFDCDTSMCLGREGETQYCTKRCDLENNSCPEPINTCTYMYIYNACTEPKE